MSRFNFDEFMAAEAAAAKQPKGNGPRPQGSGVQYFGLKNDGDEAIVRFDYSTKEDIEVVNIHVVEAGGKNRKVECLRESALEPLDNCPLCQAGYKLFKKMYVKLIEYVPQQDGTVKPEPRIWERKADFCQTIMSLMTDYGDLRECVFKVRRQGKAGDPGTTYMINYQNPRIYTSELYKADFSGFDGYDLNRYVVLKRTAQDMVTFVETGNFPAPAPKETVKEAIPTQAAYTQPKPVAQQAPVQEQAQPVRTGTTQPVRTNTGFETPAFFSLIIASFTPSFTVSDITMYPA